MDDSNGGFIAVILILFLVLALSMFTHRSPAAIDGSKPFIVERIKFVDTDVQGNRGMAIYFGCTGAQRDNSFMRPCIIAPKGLYNLGDTITLSRR